MNVIEKPIGIYKITNILNNKIYIGQSWNIPSRFNSHKLNSKKDETNKSIFYQDMNELGLENFSFEILRSIKNSPITQILLDLLEKKFISEFNSNNIAYGYNLRNGGSRGLHSEESKKKISKSHIGRKASQATLAKLRKSHLGHKQSLETIQKRIESKKGYRHSEETKKKISESNTGKTYKTHSVSEETKAILRKKNLGRKLSDETKKKISNAHLGKKPWNKGMKLSEDIRINMSLAKKDIPWSEENRKKRLETKTYRLVSKTLTIKED